ncbi:N-formylglutamate deformylase [Azospirillum halopraeferens]|uniref:N-formylglutamate deformylase n=1 Tax=Azospirillum halopraeferens TaxID=34010 RepID=UPI0003F62EA4|nr:N-formylglutamate deformylase [Azospirillum halopraeferens]
MDTYRFQPGETPVLLSIPHVGTALPPDVAARMTDAARAVPDTDWHLDRLYHFAPALGIGYLKATVSRYVVDLNRDPGGAALYQGADNTELCPLTTFDHVPLYRDGEEPDAAEVASRIETYWRPYHDRLRGELEALRARFGVAVLFDAHSIRSRVPRFFEGDLPDFNVGTADGASASPTLASRMMNVLSVTDAYSSVLNGRFKGGYITRAYGNPDGDIHTVQLELSQHTYMEEDAPFRYRDDRAALVRPCLEHLLTVVVEWAREAARAKRRSGA